MINNPVVQWHQAVPLSTNKTGADGWVDLDLSAVMSNGVAKVDCSSGGGACGVRPTGSAIDYSSLSNHNTIVRVVAGHCEAWRDVAGADYMFTGWFDGS
jgi:hypothetical protein